MSEISIKIAKGYEEAASKGNLDALDDIYQPEAVRHLPSGAVSEGLEVIKAGIANLRLLNPDLSFSAEESFEDGDKIAMRWVFRGTNSPTGKAFTNNGCVIIRLENGKIIEEWAYWDQLVLFQQMGILPSTEEILADN